MLIHVTRFTAVQEEVHTQVQTLVDDLRTRWRARNAGGDDLQLQLRGLWESDFVPTSESHGEQALAWDTVAAEIHPILQLIRVNLINAKASDALTYEEHRQQGLHVIAVGGDKLSRGLTLEGLTVSYFLRSSRLYDTLMQMGRWFGYRRGYADLCRLYLSEELAGWYADITDASEELRQEFDRMVVLGGTPKDYGLRVREHPVLAITGKLRPGTPSVNISLSATPFEPTVLPDTDEAIKQNWLLTSELVQRLGEPDQHPISFDADGPLEKRTSVPGGMLWRGVEGSEILSFLESFSFAENELTRTPAFAVRNYIKERIVASELTEWTVVVRGKSATEDQVTDEQLKDAPSFSFQMAGGEIQSIYRAGSSDGRLFRTRRIGSPGDEAIDLSPAEWNRVLGTLRKLADDPQRSKEWTRGRVIRGERPAERGLLILYPLTPKISTLSHSQKIPRIAAYVSFPHSPTARAASYTVTHRYWEDEIRGVE